MWIVWTSTLDGRDRVPFRYQQSYNYLESPRGGWEPGSVDHGSVAIHCCNSAGKHSHTYKQSSLTDKDQNMEG